MHEPMIPLFQYSIIPFLNTLRPPASLAKPFFPPFSTPFALGEPILILLIILEGPE